MNMKIKNFHQNGFHPGRFSLLIILPLLLLLNGCAAVSDSPASFSPDFGNSLKAGLAAQVIHPDAPADPSPVDTLPGELAAKIYKNRYIKSLGEENEGEDEYSINVRGLN